ncbi:MAG: heat-inducible transcriptional repressor [Acidobacteriota bacterium]|jgi:heat-inducible transcriptional repressor|nr:heat-inducible transcriptional repressor [Acidobacteriota bacterium]
MTVHSSKSQISSEGLLDARSQFVLAEIIKEHRRTGEPVGSRAIAERCASGAGWSAPTIRNVMSELEQAGLVEQPHTSAGRVPTDKGYRYYVDHLIGAARLSRVDTDTIDNLLGISHLSTGTGAARLMEGVSRLLSELSDNVGIVVSPPHAENRLLHVEFVALADGGIIVVMVFAPNVVQNRIVRTGETLSQDELDRTARYLNAEFTGKSLTAIRAEIIQLMRNEKALYDRLLRNAVLLFDRSLEDEESSAGDVYVDGASNILDKPEFANVARLRELFRTLEEKTRLVQILSECIAGSRAGDQARVRIGRELGAPSMQACALITAPYRVGAGGGVGTLGVVGPMRIEYARLMAVVNYVARRMETVFGEDAAAV